MNNTEIELGCTLSTNETISFGISIGNIKEIDELDDKWVYE